MRAGQSELGRTENRTMSAATRLLRESRLSACWPVPSFASPSSEAPLLTAVPAEIRSDEFRTEQEQSRLALFAKERLHVHGRRPARAVPRR
jgi:hypothetical protein